MQSFNKIGDEFRFTIQAFVNGNINLNNSYTEDIEGETTDRTLSKKFRYSYNGLNYTEYMDFNDANLSGINGYVDYILFMDFIYTRTGTDETGVITFNSLEINGDVTLQVNNYENTTFSIFSNILERDFYTQSLRVNLLRKVYNSGILPTFIERGEDYDDEDFISFWGSVCKFFALLTTFADEFDNIPFEKDKLREYLSQQNIGLNKTLTLGELQFLARNYLAELRKRGTIMPLLKKDVEMKDGKILEVDGEWLRIISFDPSDEFLAQFERKEHTGYWLDNSSPIYEGSYNSDAQINKINNQRLIDEILDPHSQPEISDNTIVVDPNIDYVFEFTVLIPQNTVIDNTNNLKVGLFGFNKNGYAIPNAFKVGFMGVDTDIFLLEPILSIAPQNDVKYRISLVLFNYRYDNSENGIPNINKGNNLFFGSDKVQKIIPFIDKDGIPLTIGDLSFRPLVRGLGVKDSKPAAFLQGQKFVNNYRKNNNDKIDENEVNAFISQYLIPYNYLLNSIEIREQKEYNQS